MSTTANGKAAQALGDVAFDRDEHTVGISAAGIAGRTAGGHVVAISVPAPTERFRTNEANIVAALRAAADAAPWG
jgi:DNA-binding IclR family transcriptional regulator